MRGRPRAGRLTFTDETLLRQLLFVVHGMGRNEPDWPARITRRIAGLSKAYDYRWFDAHGALDEHVEVVPIDYDGVFDRYLRQWGRSSDGLRSAASEFGVDLSGVLGWLERADETQHDSFWTHVVDVVLYRFFAIVTAEVRLRVRTALAAKLAAAKDAGGLDHSSVLAHSLGTAVAHDALALLGTQPIPTRAGPSEAWLAGRHTFANVFMCSNVSRVLETEPKVYRSVLRPPSAEPDTSYVDAYYSFRHRLDPFPAVRPFAPVGWGARYVEVECAKVLDFDVHALDHYLEDPRVHVPMLRALVGNWAVTQAEHAAAVAEYDARTEPPCVDQLVEFKVAAERIIALAKAGGDPVALTIAGTQFLAAVREARDAC